MRSPERATYYGISHGGGQDLRVYHQDEAVGFASVPSTARRIRPGGSLQQHPSLLGEKRGGKGPEIPLNEEEQRALQSSAETVEGGHPAAGAFINRRIVLNEEEHWLLLVLFVQGRFACRQLWNRTLTQGGDLILLR